jgi:hypothetical protein
MRSTTVLSKQDDLRKATPPWRSMIPNFATFNVDLACPFIFPEGSW